MASHTAKIRLAIIGDPISITDATSFDQVETGAVLSECVAFGNFQRMLADYPADTLFDGSKWLP